MNIFYLDKNFKRCARSLVDKHIVKMITEHNQLLATTHHVTNSTYIPKYKKTHVNHPSTIWVRQSKKNYIWLCKLTLAMCKEYTYRYGKIHAGEEILKDLAENIPDLPNTKWTEPTPTIPEDCIIPGDSLESYRTYYRKYKIHIHSWKKREKPFWL